MFLIENIKLVGLVFAVRSELLQGQKSIFFHWDSRVWVSSFDLREFSVELGLSITTFQSDDLEDKWAFFPWVDIKSR